jgi:coenzyme F420 hydrogenase subunit gamma
MELLNAVKKTMSVKAKPSQVATDKKVGNYKGGETVSNKIKLGHVHMSGCTGCLVSVADNYLGLIKILDDYADLVHGLTLADVRHIPEMDVALVEGSVCLQDHESVGRSRRRGGSPRS